MSLNFKKKKKISVQKPWIAVITSKRLLVSQFCHVQSDVSLYLTLTMGILPLLMDAEEGNFPCVMVPFPGDAGGPE